MEHTPLGESSPYIETYTPELLVPIKRAPIREQLGINTSRMHGVDIWNHWEVSYLNNNGKPQIACLSLTYDAMSEAIVESKSLKLYFNSLNHTTVESESALIEMIKGDLENIIGSSVTIESLDDSCLQTEWITGYGCIDDQDINFTKYEPHPSYLTSSPNIVSQRLCSHLFKTNCMVTGQPDWASVFIDYTGLEIDQAGLLRYLVSFRNHQAFHEPSCEMIFSDLLKYCGCEDLSVYCRYTRRGGIDINPFRSTTENRPENLRILRQ